VEAEEMDIQVRAELPFLATTASPRSPWWRVVLPFVLVFGTAPVVAQPAAESSAASKAPNQPDYKAESERVQARIDATVLAARDLGRYKGASAKYLQGLVQFITGNMLFVLLHELGHSSITQLKLPVLGKMEDAADSFAAQKLIRIGSGFSDGVLADAARGWFLADRRDQKTGDKVPYYDEHGLNQQRAYQIVCFMVGSDDEKFKNLAAETKLPEARQDSCVGDYSNAEYSWRAMLTPHRRAPDQPKTKIDVVYGPAKGRLEFVAQAARSIELLEVVAAGASEELAWPVPFAMEMQTCGFPNARWDLSTHKLTLCYELAADFADLYRDYGDVRADGSRLADRSRSTGLSSAYRSSQQTHRKRR
jgi:hypothetical protein